MRNIQKGKEPPELLAYRKLTGANYAGFRDTDALRKCIVEEQRGLCCYCMGRIHPTAAGMKIEHCESQEQYPDRQLDYSNLLGACKGGEGRTRREQYCDTRKGGKSLSFNPADLKFNIEAKITFLGDAEISSSNAKIFEALGPEVLNLNLAILKRNRKAVLDLFQLGLKAGKTLDAEKELRKWDGSRAGSLEPYAQIVVYYLRKKLRIEEQQRIERQRIK